jgi:cyclohexadieny/prephenate dehydrogenase
LAAFEIVGWVERFAKPIAVRRGIVETGQDSAAPDFGRPHAQLGRKAG